MAHSLQSHLSRDHFVYAPSQWETTLECNVVFHWLGAFTKWSLPLIRLAWGVDLKRNLFAIVHEQQHSLGYRQQDGRTSSVASRLFYTGTRLHSKIKHWRTQKKHRPSILPFLKCNIWKICSYNNIYTTYESQSPAIQWEQKLSRKSVSVITSSDIGSNSTTPTNPAVLQNTTTCRHHQLQFEKMSVGELKVLWKSKVQYFLNLLQCSFI